MKTRNWILLLILLAVVLLAFNMYGAYQKEAAAVRPVPCIAPDVPLQQHLHPTLQIIVDGAAEKVPADIGISAACHFALHTHDASGTVHVEAQDTYPYSLGDFFRVWQKPLEREGYSLQAFEGGQPYSLPAGDIVLKDKQQLILSYLRK